MTDFNERPYENEKDKAITYIKGLLDQARLNNDVKAKKDINELEEILRLLDSKRYGLVWEQHAEKVEDNLNKEIPIFHEEKEFKLNKGEDNNYNFLLEGDNLYSLHLLKKALKAKIDVIYIDPPYNLGHDFKYNDKFVDKDDGYRHSKWLSFMEVRLKIAKDLLKDTGVIFISIDDTEVAQLRLLCDEIFGENNFMGTLIQDKKNSKNDSTNIQKNHDYILCYRRKELYQKSSKKKVRPNLIRRGIKKRKAYKDKNGRFYYIGDAITTRGEGGVLKKRNRLGYTVYYNPESENIIPLIDYDLKKALISDEVNEVYHHDKDLIKKGYYPVIPPKVRGQLGAWTWSIDNLKENINNIIVTSNKGKYTNIKKKIFVDPNKVKKDGNKLIYFQPTMENSKSIIEFSTNDGTKSLNDVMGKAGTFNNPKNVDMIKYLISLIPNKNANVLDFFAGSGTTAQAVLELNSEDNGNRKFFLCTNNENNICREVTYPRIKTVITGKRLDGSEYSHGLNTNLKYFKVDFVSKNNDDLEKSILENIRTLVELQNKVDINKSNIAIVITKKELEELNLVNVKKVYIRSRVRRMMIPEEQERYQNANVELINVPEEFFANEMEGLE